MSRDRLFKALDAEAPFGSLLDELLEAPPESLDRAVLDAAEQEAPLRAALSAALVDEESDFSKVIAQLDAPPPKAMDERVLGALRIKKRAFPAVLPWAAAIVLTVSAGSFVFKGALSSKVAPLSLSSEDSKSPERISGADRRRHELQPKMRVPSKTAWRRASDSTENPKLVGDLLGLEVGAALSEAQIRRVVQENRRAVSACFQRSITGQEGLRGKLEYELMIRPTGQVTRVRLETNAFKGSRLGRCIAKELKSWRFPSFEGAPQRIVVPFVLAP